MPEIGLPEHSEGDRHKGMGKGETWETQGSPICETIVDFIVGETISFLKVLAKF